MTRSVTSRGSGAILVCWPARFQTGQASDVKYGGQNKIIKVTVCAGLTLMVPGNRECALTGEPADDDV